MSVQIAIQKEEQLKEAISQDKVDVCQNCGNTFLLIWLKYGCDFNDFGLRHCPFCGLLTEELTGDIVV